MNFKDEKGNEWHIRLNIGLLQEIDEVIPDFSGSIVRDTEKLLGILWSDPQKLVMILWILCEDQAKERQITPKKFASLFTRDVLDSASECLLAEFMVFFQHKTVGEKMRQAFPGMMKKIKARMEHIATQAINEASLKLDTV